MVRSSTFDVIEVRQEAVIVLHLVAMESQCIPYAGQYGCTRNVAAPVGDTQRGKPEAGRRDRCHPSAIADSGGIEGLRAIQHLSIVGVCLFQEEHARALLQIIEKGDILVCELVGCGGNWPNLYLL